MTSKKKVQEGKRGKTRRRWGTFQDEFLSTIRTLTAENSVPPSLTEIASACQVTKGAASQMVTRLRKKGLILPSTGKYRNIRVA